MFRTILCVLSCVLLLAACKKDTHNPAINNPSVSAFLPLSGPMGSEVRIAGRLFNADKSKNLVKFNGVVAQVVEASVDELKVIVPDGAATGKIAVTVEGRTGTSANDFTVTGARLVITQITPERSESGTITIKGNGFVQTPAGIQVRIGNVEATVEPGATESQLVVTVPATVHAGDHDITVVANGQSVTKTKGYHKIGWMIRTVAGSGQDGTADGAGTAASFSNPGAMAADKHGNIYIIDRNVIRKISTDFRVQTVAGTGATGSTDGAALTEASFRAPTALAVDNAGNIYVADEGNHVIRKIGTDGMVSTFAGSTMQQGSMDGVGLNAGFNRPKGLDIDAANEYLYVGDWSNARVRKINLATREVSTLAGNAGFRPDRDGVGAEVMINFPGQVTVKDGAVFVGQANSGRIRKIDIETGEVSTLVQGLIDMPNYIAFDADNNLFVLSTGSAQVAKYAPNGQVITNRIAGSQIINDEDGAADQVSFRNPNGFVAVKRADNKIRFYISDSGNKKIRELYYE